MMHNHYDGWKIQIHLEERWNMSLTFLKGYNRINHQYYSKLLQNWITFATFGAIIIDLTKDNMFNTNHQKLTL